MFAINTFLMVLATLHCLIFLDWQTRQEQKSLKEAGVKNPFTDFFDTNNIVQTVVTLTRRRSNNKRLFLWLLLTSMAFYTFQRGNKFSNLTILPFPFFIPFSILLLKQFYQNYLNLMIQCRELNQKILCYVYA